MRDFFLLSYQSSPLSRPPFSVSSANHGSHRCSKVRADQDGDWPLLPGPVPVQGNGNGTKPRADPGADGGPVDAVERESDGNDVFPGSRIEIVNVDQRQHGEQGDVDGAEKGMENVGSSRSAKQNQETKHEDGHD